MGGPRRAERGGTDVDEFSAGCLPGTESGGYIKDILQKDNDMNIKQAKEYIKQTVQLYLKKDEFDRYRIPVVRQRPIFLIGAPGLGKTAIMEQIVGELQIALVSYSMTHHTRQSALGLPFIKHCTYGGEEVDITEYTMSEIISSIYDTMEASGIREGILFLDEINCVSETLSPSMLQFLQYKVFGRHSVPDGWVIVTAGNPPEYNKSVREFDVVVMDRLKIMQVTPDYSIWKDYALAKGLHPAIINFLDLKTEFFYKIENTAAGRTYVTARGWEDLSEIIRLYEEEKLPVMEELIGQYICNEDAVKEFGAYYDLYNKYKKDYRVDEILSGTIDDKAVERAAKAPFDERLSLLGMLLDAINSQIRDVIGRTDYLSQLAPILKGIMNTLEAGKSSAGDAADADASADGAEYADAAQLTADALLLKTSQNMLTRLNALKKAGALSDDKERSMRSCIRFFENARREVLGSDFGAAKEMYAGELNDIKAQRIRVKDSIRYLFEFADKAFEGGNEMVILVTSLTVNPYAAKFIARFGSDEYKAHSDELMIAKRTQELKAEVDELLEL